MGLYERSLKIREEINLREMIVSALEYSRDKGQLELGSFDWKGEEVLEEGCRLFCFEYGGTEFDDPDIIKKEIINFVGQQCEAKGIINKSIQLIYAIGIYGFVSLPKISVIEQKLDNVRNIIKNYPSGIDKKLLNYED